jgi:DNA-binding response OmpR family regulator
MTIPFAETPPMLLAAIAEPGLRLQVLQGLPDHGWRVLTAGAGEEIPLLVAQHSPDVLLLDMEMADRAAGVVRTLPMLRVVLLPPGHDDVALTLLRAVKVNVCLPWPSDLELLAATLSGLLRLSKPSSDDESNLMSPRSGESVAVWMLERTTWTLTPPDALPVRLTQAETTFLVALAENPGAPVARPQMIAALGHNVDYYDSRRLDTLLSRLRLKVGKGGGQPLPVRSIHSVGYAFAAPIQIED